MNKMDSEYSPLLSVHHITKPFELISEFALELVS